MKWPIVIAIFIGGLLVGAYLSAWQGPAGPANTNECIMSQLGDMRSKDAVDLLYFLCEERFGKL